MTNEEIQEIVAKADAEYDRLKDRVHEQYDEIKRLNNIIKKVLFILEHMKDDRVGYEVCIDLLKGEDKE